MQQWKSKTSFTHLLLNGGKLNVPQDQMNLFFEQYIDGLTHGPQYIVECKTPVFRFHLDIDYVDTHEMSEDMLDDFCFESQNVLKNIFIGDTSCIVCLADSKHTNKGIKSGVHLIFHNIWVTKDIALEVRKRIVHKMSCETPSKDWKDIIDVSVLKQNGFRFPWSRKASRCKKNCSRCIGCIGYVDEGRPYRPQYIQTHEGGKTDINPDPSIDGLKLLSIRSTPDTVQTDYHKEKLEVTSREVSTYTEIHNICLSNLIEQFIRTIPGYSDTRVRNIFKHDETYTIVTDSHYCQNICSEHSSNHVYFVIVNGMIHQRCFSKHGSCGIYKSISCNITLSIKELLYGKKQQSKPTDNMKMFLDKYC